MLHVYHAGAGNVDKALTAINPSEGGMPLIRQLWQTTAGQFGRSSQACSQLAVSALLELDQVLGRNNPRSNDLPSPGLPAKDNDPTAPPLPAEVTGQDK